MALKDESSLSKTINHDHVENKKSINYTFLFLRARVQMLDWVSNNWKKEIQIKGVRAHILAGNYFTLDRTNSTLSMASVIIASLVAIFTLRCPSPSVP